MCVLVEAAVCADLYGSLVYVMVGLVGLLFGEQYELV